MTTTAAKRQIVLLQGPQSVEFCISSLPRSSQWICYDARSAAALRERDISFKTDEDYFESAEAVNEWEEKALSLTLEWAEKGPWDSKKTINVEFFFVRGFFYYFIVLFRGFYLLDRISQKEAPCILWTVRVKNNSASGWRYTGEDSPVAGLLDMFGERWGFDVKYLDLPSQPQKKKVYASNAFQDFLCKKLPLIQSIPRSKAATILVRGNPSLMGPVAEVLEKQLHYSCCWIRPLQRWQESRLLLEPNYILAPYRQTLKKPILSNASLGSIKHVFQKSGLFRLGEYDFLPIALKRLTWFYQHAYSIFQEDHADLLKMLRQLKPAYLLADEDSTEFNRSLISAANQLNVPSMVIAHGITRTNFCPQTMIAKKIAVWGKPMQDFYEQAGVRADRIVTAGCPKYDKLAVKRNDLKPGRDKLCRAFSFDCKKPIITVLADVLKPTALEGFEGLTAKTWEILDAADTFIAAARRLAQFNFIFKIKLGKEDPLTLKCLTRKHHGLPENFVWISSGSAFDYIKAADLIFTGLSSGYLESMLVGKPTIMLSFSRYSNQHKRFTLDFPLPVARSQRDIEGYCLDFQSQRLPLNDWISMQEGLINMALTGRDGRAASRIAESIHQELKSI